MASKNKKKAWAENGLEDWGAYMAAKKEKLEDQFDQQAQKEFQDATSLFSGIAIFVNGYTNPCADELKRLMMAHGGIYHHYMRSRITTHIIASNLPYSKIVMYRKSQNPLPICKPEWITDSLKARKLLDWRPYILYSNCTKTQPQLQFTGKSCNSFLSAGTPISTVDCDSDEQEGVAATIAAENMCTRTATVKSDGTGSSSIGKMNNGPMSTKNSEFLSEFYNNSRLHHISTMGTMFKDYVNELRSKSDGIFPGLTRLKTLTRWSNSRPMNMDNSDSEEDLFESPPIESAKVNKSNEPIIMHIDMDCFFVSVGLRNRPELKGFPIAVTHAKGNRQRTKISKNGKTEDEEYGSMSEVASCSYEAREAGVKNGMFLGQALKLCPNLKTIQYDFEGYKEVSYALYDTVASYTLCIEAVSCDEMYADVTNVLVQARLTPLKFASLIRDEIRNKTGCPVSTGFGCNKLQARLATRKAKPDGQFHLESVQFKTHIGSMGVRDLPGVGYSTMQLMKKMNVRTCSELYNVPLGVLQKEFGKKTGEMLYNMCRGIDNSKLTVEHVRKSVSAEVNYGIRFENGNEAEIFLGKLSEEVCNRLHKTNAKGRLVTLKLMVRAKDAPREAMKFMGHGICDNFTKSKNCIAPTDDPIIITREVISLWNQMQQSYEDIRGIGIQISRLELLNARSGSASIMNFINKSKKPEIETTTETSRESSSEGIQSTVNFVVPGRSNNEKFTILNQELKEAKPRGLKSFLVPKAQFSSNRNAFVDHNSKLSSRTLDTGDIDQSILDELPEHVRKEILGFRSDSRISNNCESEPSTSTACKVMKHDNPNGPSARNEKISQPQPVTHSDQGPPMTNIDQSILNELPEDIRNEILGSAMTEKSSSKQGPKKSTVARQTQQERYFKHSKSSSGKCEKAKMPPIEEIDMSVLIELPEDIRNEIINEYKANKEAQQCKDNINSGDMERKGNGVTEQQEHNRTSGEQTIQEDVNLSFSQVDPAFLAALSEDMKTDVEMYCMVKKKEKLIKMKKNSEANSATNKQFPKNPNVLISNKKNLRFPKSSKVTNNVKNLNDRRTVQKSPEETKKPGTAKADETRSKIGNPISGRFLGSEFHDEGEISGSLKRREEIISHHSSFTGNIAKTDEQEMLTDLVNYLFTLPLEQAKMQIQRWISNSDDVNEIDLLSLATFLSMLPKKKRLEDLHILLKTMHRCIMKTGSCVWHETYRRTVYHVQRYMLIEYKSNMMLPTIECDLRECKSASR